MQVLSATQAIAPAWNHTRDLLLRPRRWQLLLKIGAVACFAQIGGGGCNARLPMNSHGALAKLPPAFAGAMIAFLILVSILGLAIALVSLYVGSRLQFVLFDIVLRRDTRVGPIWTRFGGVTWRWIGLKLLLCLFGSLTAAVLAAPFVLAFYKIFHGSPAHPHWMSYLPLILAAAGVGLLWLVVFMACFLMLVDFGLPSIALEATPIREAVRRIFALLRLETGQVLLYLLLRVCLSFVAALTAEIGLVLGALVALIPFGGIGFGLWAGLHHSGIVGRVFMGLGFGVLGLVYLTLFVIVAIMLLGYVYTFLQAYAIYFLAGRYPLMGDMLDRYTPPPPLDHAPVPYPYPPPTLSTPEAL